MVSDVDGWIAAPYKQRTFSFPGVEGKSYVVVAATAVALRGICEPRNMVRRGDAGG
jgi:hypothetical protein